MIEFISDEQGRIFATQRGYGDWKDWWEFPGDLLNAVIRLIRQPEINQHNMPVVFPHKHIVRLDVPMYDARLVNILDCLT